MAASLPGSLPKLSRLTSIKVHSLSAMPPALRALRALQELRVGGLQQILQGRYLAGLRVLHIDGKSCREFTEVPPALATAAALHTLQLPLARSLGKGSVERLAGLPSLAHPHPLLEFPSDGGEPAWIARLRQRRADLRIHSLRAARGARALPASPSRQHAPNRPSVCWIALGQHTLIYLHLHRACKVRWMPRDEAHLHPRPATSASSLARRQSEAAWLRPAPLASSSLVAHPLRGSHGVTGLCFREERAGGGGGGAGGGPRAEGWAAPLCACPGRPAPLARCPSQVFFRQAGFPPRMRERPAVACSAPWTRPCYS